jgi:Protein of unknown function (DUF3984)
MALASLFSFDGPDSYDGDVETCSSYTERDILLTPPFIPTPRSSSPVRFPGAQVSQHMRLRRRLSALQRYDELNVLQASSRSNSTLTFSPGSHRRSHPNLQHLSLAPLTPNYPITPSDYNAYIDPDTSQLHTSSSLSHIANMPSPGGILSPSGSRPTSKHRQRKSTSTVSMRITPSTPRGALTSEGFGGKITDPAERRGRQNPAGWHKGPRKNDPSWLLQTGMALTEGSRESKGQSWLAKRASSTSLESPLVEDYPKLEHTQAKSGRDMTARSRTGSRDLRRSRRELTMTPAAIRASFTAIDDPTTENQEGVSAISTPHSSHDYASIEPDWADSQTQAEIAADLEMDLADELEDGELYSEAGDRYGVLDFEGQGIEDEEKEIEQAVRARGFGIGRWVDGVVDVFLKMDDVDEEEMDMKQERLDHESVTTTKEENQQNSRPAQLALQELDDVASDDEIEPPPQNPKSVWEDLAWFGRLVFRTARS